jgi:hypothetical protein
MAKLLSIHYQFYGLDDGSCDFVFTKDVICGFLLNEKDVDCARDTDRIISNPFDFIIRR